MNGESNQTTASGPITERPTRLLPNVKPSATRVNKSAGSMKTTNEPGSFRTFVSASAADTHSSSFFRETSCRYSARTIASHMSHAWCGRKTNESAICAVLVRKSPQRDQKWLVHGRPRGCISKPVVTCKYTGNAITRNTKRLHNSADPGTNAHEKTSHRNKEGALRLRRRLSRIFQRAINGSRFRTLRPSPLGTVGNSQRTICQSPRVHRCDRFACAS